MCAFARLLTRRSFDVFLAPYVSSEDVVSGQVLKRDCLAIRLLGN